MPLSEVAVVQCQLLNLGSCYLSRWTIAPVLNVDEAVASHMV